MNDPGLITLVNKLQDVFTTVGVSSERNVLETGKIADGTRFKIP